MPEFWAWLVHVGDNSDVKIPIEIYEEVKEFDDELGIWTKNSLTEGSLVLAQEPDQSLVARVVEEGYASDLTDVEVEKIGRDPFLVTYALNAPGEISVVTTEVSKPKRQRANRHLPDVCHTTCRVHSEDRRQRAPGPER